MKNKKQIKKVSRKAKKAVSQKAVIKRAFKAASKVVAAKAKKDGDLLNFRAPEFERKAFKEKAKKFANGNMSAWLRFAGANFNPKKVPKNLGVVQSSFR